MGLYPSSGSHGTVALWIRGGVVAEQAERLVRDLGLEVPRMTRRPDRRGDAFASTRPGPAAQGTLPRARATSRCRTAPRCSARCARDPVHVTGYLEAADTRSTLNAVRALRRAGRGGRRPRHADDPRAGAARGAPRRTSTSATRAR